jgi:nitrous oxidase accessory protein NosD
LEKRLGTRYHTIQTAINEANAGDTILVGPGTYNESLTIDKSVTLRSAKGAAETTLDGDHSSENYYMVKIKADNVTLDGFTITNPKYNGTADASGIVIGLGGRKSNIRITNCVIHDIGTPNRENVSFGTFGLNVGPVDGLEIANCHIYNIKNGDG